MWMSHSPTTSFFSLMWWTDSNLFVQMEWNSSIREWPTTALCSQLCSTDSLPGTTGSNNSFTALDCFTFPAIRGFILRLACHDGEEDNAFHRPFIWLQPSAAGDIHRLLCRLLCPATTTARIS